MIGKRPYYNYNKAQAPITPQGIKHNKGFYVKSISLDINGRQITPKGNKDAYYPAF